jgi:succinate dehydrogenase / fumarate reductase cytochrome b subunit
MKQHMRMNVTYERSGPTSIGVGARSARREGRPMARLREFWRSTVGKKAIAAATGGALWLWLVLHMLGNLSAFSGAAAIDGYAAALHRSAALLWTMRVLLLAAFAAHVAATVALAQRARTARPIDPVRVQRRAASWAGRGMRWGGALLFAFVVFHVLHMTVGALHPKFVSGHVYANLVQGLDRGGMAALYTAAAGLVALHLLHGLWSAPRSLGLTARGFRALEHRPLRPRRLRRPRWPAALAAALFVGFAAVPLAVMLGVLR